MASRWGSQQKRKWTTLNMDETPGSFRRLGEDEATRQEWPAATLPPSAINGRGAGTREGHDQGSARQEGPDKATESHQGHGKVSQKGDKPDTSSQPAHSEGKVATKHAMSASLPREKRADKKPSLFKAFTWSKGKKSRPKLNEAEGSENTPEHPEDRGTEPETPESPTGHEEPPYDYSERAVDVPDDDNTHTTRSARSSSSSSSSSSSNDESTIPASPHGTTTSKTPDKKQAADETQSAPRKSKTIRKELQTTSSSNVDRSVSEKTAGSPLTPNQEKPLHDPKMLGKNSKKASAPEPDTQPIQDAHSRGGYSGKAVKSPTTPAAGSQEDTEQDLAARESRSEKARCDTGRRFRLEATVLVDDERPTERRVTYLGPVMLSPLHQSHVQYVHVTVAPGSCVQASEGSSLMVRPAEPVNGDTGPVAMTSSTGEDGGRAPLSPNTPSQVVSSKHIQLSSARASKTASLATVDLGASSEPCESETRVTADVMDAQESFRIDASPWGVDNKENEDVEAMRRNPDEVVDVGDALLLGSGEESLIMITEDSQVAFEPAPSPIPVDQSVVGSSSPAHCVPAEPGSAGGPFDGGNESGSEPAPAPRPPDRPHRRSGSRLSSTSSASSSSTSSRSSKSKQKSYNFGEPDESTQDTSESQYTFVHTEKSIMKPDKLSTATEESPSERVTASEQCGASISTENRADNPQRRSFSRPHLELLDPHVLLAGDGGKHKTESRDISPGAENSCDYKTRTTPGVGIPEISVGSQPHDAEKSTSLIAKQDENLCVEEPVMMRQSVNRPQKPARTSLVKEEITETNAAPLNSAIDRPLLPLKGTPRESSSSSSSSSDSEDGVNKKKSPADATECLQGVQTEKRDGAETERHEPQVRTEGLGEQQNDSSSADSSQFFTDTSQVDQVDKPDSSEIRVKNVEASERKPCFSAPNFAPSDTVVSPPASQKGSSDSDRSTGSFTKGKKDTRKPPVFVTPPPPPEKPVRTCGSQSDLSEKSDIEQDIVRSPPKPARSMDRLSPSLSSAFDRDNQKGSPNTSVSSAPSSSESNQETRPPLVPPRREKPRMNGANHVELSSNLSDPDSVNTVMPRQAELKVDQLKPSSIAVQPLNKSYDHSGASAFVPYENSEIYYTDSASPQQHKDENSSPKTPLSSGSDQIKKENLQEKKIYRSDKSGSSSDESKRENDYSPPPVPPRQKTSSKKATVKNMPNMNSSTSSAVSQDSKGSRNQPSSADPMKPTFCLETATSITHNRPEIVFSSDFGTNKAPVATSLQVGASPEIHDRSDSSFELEVPMTESPSPRSFHSDVKLPLKPLRSPSPKVSRARTPSPKVAAPLPPSPETAARSTKSTFRPITSPSSVTESAQHTDEDTSEADTKTSMNRSVSMSSTTSATSHEDDKAKKGSKSRLRKYWPFRRKRGNKKDRKMEVQDADYEKSVSSPHLASLPLHHSTPTLERFASDPNTVGPSTSNNTDQHAESRPEDSDTSTLSESATKPNKEKKTKDKSSDKGKANLSASTSGSERDKDKKVKDKEKNKNNTANEGKEKADSSGNQSAGSSKNVTPTVERRSKGSKKAEEKESTRHSEDKQNVGKEHDTSTSSSSSARSSKDGKTGKDKEDTESKNFMDLPLTPPRVATPIREHSPAFYSVPHHTPQAEIQYNRFDGEFQRLDEDLQADADMATAVAEKRPPMVVVAVDLGTTHSGYAFSFSRDPSSVYVMSRWAGQEPGLLNHKTLSAVLLTPDHRFHSFGLAARNHYHNLLPIEARHWLYFERFKMTLHHSKELSRETLVTAVNGTQLPALTIFAHVLDFFVTHALQQLSDQSGTEFRRQDVRWVVTVPAIWREPAKQLMRQAALVAGMFTRADPSQLLIVLEPEAASIYCRRLRMHQLVPEGGGARPLQSPRRSMEIVNNTPAVSNLTVDGSRSCESLDSLSEPTLESKVKGTRYLVVDCGGGTVDITVHELSSSGQLVELHRATGGPHGSTGVDAEFEALLRSIFSSDFMDNYQRQYPVGWVNLMTDFESRKRAASPFKTTSFNVSLPFTFISEYRKHKGEVDQAVKKHGDPEVEWSLQGMLRLAPTAMKRLFTPTLISIRQAIGDVLNHPNTRDLRYLFLVGGFAESPLLQHEVRREFGHLLTVLIPQDVSLAVLRGAVLFGLDPKVVSVRCARLTYGVGILNRFDPDKHPDQKRVHRDGTDWCTDVFDRFVGINQPMALGTSITRRYTPARAGQLLIVLNIYSSVNPAPTFITDPGVSKCGTLYLDLRRSSSSTAVTTTTTSDADSDLKGGEGEGSQGCPPREILAKMAFGDTEISVTALDVRTGKEVKASVDFLSG